MSRGHSSEDRHVSAEPVRPIERNESASELEVDRENVPRSSGEESHLRTAFHKETQRTKSGTIEPRTSYGLRSRTYMLRSSELQTMADIGKFRALDSKDLLEFAYRGDRRLWKADLASLRRQGLTTERKVPHRDTGLRRLIALTKKGRRLLKSTKNPSNEQAVYYGFTKPREADHDADLYRLYQRGLERIAGEGGKPVRVVLDAELKKIVYRDIAKASRSADPRDARAEVAEQHGLHLVRGKIPVPDLRIEYETADGQFDRLDLELATEHYRARSLNQKALAGFSLYARREDASILRRVLDQQEITAEILNL